MRHLLIAATLALGGCAATPEEWQRFGEALNQAVQNYNQQQQYLRSIRPINCYSHRMGMVVHTTCY